MASEAFAMSIPSPSGLINAVRLRQLARQSEDAPVDPSLASLSDDLRGRLAHPSGRDQWG